MENLGGELLGVYVTGTLVTVFQRNTVTTGIYIFACVPISSAVKKKTQQSLLVILATHGVIQTRGKCDEQLFQSLLVQQILPLSVASNFLISSSVYPL